MPKAKTSKVENGQEALFQKKQRLNVLTCHAKRDVLKALPSALPASLRGFQRLPKTRPSIALTEDKDNVDNLNVDFVDELVIELISLTVEKGNQCNLNVERTNILFSIFL